MTRNNVNFEMEDWGAHLHLPMFRQPRAHRPDELPFDIEASCRHQGQRSHKCNNARSSNHRRAQRVYSDLTSSARPEATTNLSQRYGSPTHRRRSQPFLLHLQGPVYIMPRNASELGVREQTCPSSLSSLVLLQRLRPATQEQNSQSGSRGDANFV